MSNWSRWIRSRTLGPWLQKMVSVRRNSIVREQMIGASLQKIWKSYSTPLSTKIRLTKALVWPVAMYGCESWTLRKKKHILIPLRWKGWERFCRFRGQQRKSNEWVLNKAGVKRELLDTVSVKARNLAYYGHTMRKQRSCLEKEITQGTMPRARRRGRPRTHGLDGQHEYVDRTPCGTVNDRELR